MPAPMRLVYSFAVADEAFYRQLSLQLQPLVQQGLISEWNEKLIPSGAVVEQERLKAWHAADIILLLLSADYFASSDYNDQEMQWTLERQRSNQVLIVPILVRPCDWQSSIVGHLQCLPRDGKAISQWANSDEAFLSIVQELRQFIATRQSSSVPLTLEQRANRQGLLRRVRTIWIEGVLEPSLQHAVWIDLHLQRRADALERAWSLMVQELDHRPRSLPPGTTILQVFEKADQELFILGDPGAGKTTLLLYLARTLLDRADLDESRRIPVVFNLSSWSQRRLPLDQWMIEELRIRYLIPLQMGRVWVETNQIFPLLDGLDEVAEPARVGCVQVITDYAQRSLDPTPIVLCCRTQEYEALAKLPPIYYAILLLPFTEEQMERYLSSVSGPIDTLRQALHEDRELFELARRPLMLSIFTQAYEGEAPSELPASASNQDYPHALFEHYIKNMLHRRAQWSTASEEQMYRWLTYFATQLYHQQRTIFAVEELQPIWLPEHLRPLYRWSMPLVYALTFGLIFGPIFGLSFGGIYEIISGSASKLSFGIVFGLVVGIVGGLIGGLVFGLTFKHHETIQPAEITVWSWASMRQGMGAWVLGGIILGTAAGLIGGFLTGLSGGVVVGLIAFLLLTSIGVLLGGLPPVQLSEKEGFAPNEGIWRSGKRGFLLVLLAILLFGLSGGAIVALFGQSLRDLQSGLVLGLVLGAAGGLSFGLAFGRVGGRTGFAAFLQHFTLRVFLWRYKLLPWNLVAFLDEATKRLLLHKVGGSYIFVHRLLRDVLATQRNNAS